MSRKQKPRHPVEVCRCRHRLGVHNLPGYPPGCSVCPCKQYDRLIEREAKPDITKNYHKGNIHSVAANPHPNDNLNNEERILEFIISCGMSGATCDEIEKRLNMRHQTASSRCTALKAKKLVIESGTRPTSSGSDASVLRATVVENRVLRGVKEEQLEMPLA